jgi:hypothetical protein
MKPEAKFQLHYNKEELHFKPNQVAVIKVIVEIRVLHVHFLLTIFLVFFMIIVVESLKQC